VTQGSAVNSQRVMYITSQSVSQCNRLTKYSQVEHWTVVECLAYKHTDENNLNTSSYTIPVA